MAINFTGIQGLTNQVLSSAAGAASTALGNLGSSALNGAVNQLLGSLNQPTGGSIPASLGISEFDPGVDQVKASLSRAGTLVFPQDLPAEKAFYKMTLYEYVRPSVDKGYAKNPVCTIGLPIPTNLAEQFQMRYNDIEIGAILGNKKVQAAAEDVVNALRTEGKGVDRSALSSSVKGATEEVVKGVVPLAVRNIAKTMDAGLGALVDQIKGGVPNPNLALLYQGHGFRSFNFSWKLVPRNSAESTALLAIVETIKFAMHPKRNGLFLDFPYQVEPEMLVGGKKLFPIKMCAITGFNVNFAPSGIPAFFSETSHPVEVDISMTLQENEIFTQADFKPTLSGVTNLNF